MTQQADFTTIKCYTRSLEASSNNIAKGARCEYVEIADAMKRSLEEVTCRTAKLYIGMADSNHGGQHRSCLIRSLCSMAWATPWRPAVSIAGRVKTWKPNALWI